MTRRRILFYAGLLVVPLCAMKMIAQNLDPASGRFAEVEKRQRPLLTVALKEKGLAYGAPVFLRAFKETDELELWLRDAETAKFVLFKTYPILAASGKFGPKRAEGDGQVPEGFYAFGKKALNPRSSYHLSFDIGYPNAFDRHHGRTGSYIMIHGSSVSIGCLAMGDPAIEEIYTLVEAALGKGQPFVRVHVFPFRMTEERLKAAAEDEAEAPWSDFWRNLREGHDAFEKKRVPPEADLDPASGRYLFR